MLLFTSVPPHFSRKSPKSGKEIGKDYLARCIQSWRRNGFEPVSLNRPDEVDAVRALGLIDCKAVDNHEARLPTKFGPSLGAIFDNSPFRQSVAIVNADVYMLYGLDIAHRVSTLCDSAFVAGRRVDVKNLGARKGRVFELGYDLVAFRTDRIPKTVSNAIIRKFQLGSPWWDYAFPYSCSLEIKALRIKEPLLAHQLHPDRWDPSTWAEIGLEALRACPSITNARIRKMLGSPGEGPAIGQAFIDNLFGERFAEVSFPLFPADPLFWRPPALRDPNKPKRDPIGRKIRRHALSKADRYAEIFRGVAKEFTNPREDKRDPIGRKLRRAAKRALNSEAENAG